MAGMKAMILAAGRGERMRPLTDHTPKPLLPAAGKPLIEHTIVQLVAGGFTEIIINHAHLGFQIEERLGDGEHLGAIIHYSPEGEQALETAGGIINALPLLGTEPFLVVNGDIATDFPFASLRHQAVGLAHLVLVVNPPHHPHGDFALDGSGWVREDGGEKFTFSGVGVYRPELFDGLDPGIRKLAPILHQAMAVKQVTGQVHAGFWMDIGTPERLSALDALYNELNSLG